MKRKAFVLIIIAGLLWGSSGIFVHLMSPYGFSALQMTACRGAVSFLCMAGYVLIKDRSLFKVKLRDLVLYFGIGAVLYLTAACYYYAIGLTSVSTAVMLMYTAPIFVAVASVIMFGEKMTRTKVIAIAVMLAGCCFISGIIGGFSFDLLGVILALSAGIAYAAYNIFTKIAMRRGCDPLSVTVWGFFFMALIALCTANPVGIVKVASLAPLETLPLMIGLGVCTFVVPYFLYTLGIRELPAGTASALSIIEPMSATVYSFAFLGEPMTVTSLIGIVLIIGSVLMLGREE